MPQPPVLDCRLINASVAAYYIDSSGQIPSTSPGYAGMGGLLGSPVCFIGGTDTIDAGFVAETKDNWVFLVFRGTLPPFSTDFWRWIDDWLQDFDAGPVPWVVGGKPYGNVEAGFAEALLILWPQVAKALSAIDLKTKNGVIVTGHSKGAAVAFPAASLVKAIDPHTLVQARCFAAPLVCDSTFRACYQAAGLWPHTVRYQNEYDAVPFLPYLPVFDMLASAERVSKAKRTNDVMTADRRARFLQNDYVTMGQLRFIATAAPPVNCLIEYGDTYESQALDDLLWALFTLNFTEIADAHSAQGRYLTCVCG